MHSRQRQKWKAYLYLFFKLNDRVDGFDVSDGGGD